MCEPVKTKASGYSNCQKSLDSDGINSKSFSHLDTDAHIRNLRCTCTSKVAPCALNRLHSTRFHPKLSRSFRLNYLAIRENIFNPLPASGPWVDRFLCQKPYLVLIVGSDDTWAVLRFL